MSSLRERISSRLDVINKNYIEISKENLQQKILDDHRGGLYYKINPLLYYLLINYGFNVQLMSATVYDQSLENWSIDHTHVAILLTYHQRNDLIDSGFASFLPLSSIPFTGEVVRSTVRNYRIRKLHTEKGSCVFEIQDKDTLDLTDWKWGYTFSLNEISEIELN